MRNKKLIIVVTITIAIVIGLVIIGITHPSNRTYITTGPEFTGQPLANFTGGKSQAFYEDQSDSNYNAARDFIGDFLINSEKVVVKSGTKTTVLVEITDYKSEYGDNSEFITNVEFKSLDNDKSYKAQIVNYLNVSKSSKFIVKDHNYEKTFGNL